MIHVQMARYYKLHMATFVNLVWNK